jgi:hypothetical protein
MLTNRLSATSEWQLYWSFSSELMQRYFHIVRASSMMDNAAALFDQLGNNDLDALSILRAHMRCYESSHETHYYIQAREILDKIEAQLKQLTLAV